MNLLEKALLPIAPGLVNARLKDRAQAMARDAAMAAALPAMQAMGPGTVGGESSSARGGSRWWMQ